MRYLSVAIITAALVGAVVLLFTPAKALFDAGFGSASQIATAIATLAGVALFGVCSLVTISVLGAKGYGAGVSFLIGMLLGPVGIVVALLMPARGKRE